MPPSGGEPVDARAHEEHAIEILAVESLYPGERRLCRRYPIRVGVGAWALGDAAVLITGTTLNISSTGLLLSTRDPVQSDARLRVWVDWPLPSTNGKPLRLWSGGKVIWRSGDLVGLRVHGWTFREESAAAAPASDDERH